MAPPSKLPLPVRLAALAVASGAAAATVGLLVRNREGLMRKLTDLTRTRLSVRKGAELLELDVGELLSRVAETVRASHPGRTLKLEGGPARGYGDSGQLFEVFASVMGTALDSGQPVTVTSHEEDAWVTVAVHHGGEQASHSLGAVQDILQAHGGQLEVHPSNGAGTTVTVRLPRATSTAQL